MTIEFLVWIAMALLVFFFAARAHRAWRTRARVEVQLHESFERMRASRRDDYN